MTHQNYAPLMKLTEFQEQSKLLEEDLIEEVEQIPCDIDISDLQYNPPYVEIEKAIVREIREREQIDYDGKDPERLVRLHLLEHAAVPTLQELEEKIDNCTLISIQHRRCFNKGAKRRWKQVNYLPPPKRRDVIPEGTEQVDPTDLILTIALYHHHRIQKTQAFRVLGSQPLTVLRDRLYCLNDHILDGPLLKSGFFYFEGTFYNDLRSERALDYSAGIGPWLSDKHRGSAKVDVKYRRMDEALFVDLEVSIGKKYLYCHQGDCEHFIIFEEIRKIIPGDSLVKKDYPLQVFQCKISRKNCDICNIFPTKYVTYGDKLAPESPALFCSECYDRLHYGEDRRVLFDDYKVFEYHHK